MRVLKEHQILDGCPELGYSVEYRIPLRGLHMKYLTPTAKNVFNKFSVRFFLRFVVRLNSETIETTECCEPEEIDSNFIEVVFWR